MESRSWLTLGLILLVGALIYVLSPVLMPFVTAAILAYLTDPLVNQLQRLKIPRVLAVTIVFMLLIVGVGLLVLVLIPLLEDQIVALISKVPDIIAWIQHTVIPWLDKKFNITIAFDPVHIKNSLSKHLQSATGIMENLWRTVTSSSMAIIAWFANLLLIPVVMFYLLRDWHGVLKGTRQLLPRRMEPTATGLLRECDEVLSAFLRGQLIVMIALGILYTIGLSIVGLDLALLIGMISGLVSIVPYLGFIVGIASASIAAIFQFHDLIHVVYVAIVFIIAQSIEGMVLTPLLIGDKIGLHPVAVIFAILAGGQLFGFVGILLALPVAAVVMVFIRHFRRKYMESRLYQKQPVEQEDQCPPN